MNPQMLQAMAMANHMAMQQQNEALSLQMSGGFAPYGYPAMAAHPMAGQMAPQMPPVPLVPQNMSQTAGAPRAERSRSPPMNHGTRVPDMPDFFDDDKKLSKTYKALGMVWLHGERRCCPKKFRCSLTTCCNPDEFPMVKVSQLSEEFVDLLVFILTGVSPNTKVTDLGVQTKRQAREALRRQYLVRLKKNPSRFDIMSAELDNLPLVAMRSGFDPQLFSPQLKANFANSLQNMGMMPGHASNGDSASSGLTPSQRRDVPQIEDGSAHEASTGSASGPSGSGDSQVAPPINPVGQPSVALALPPLKLPARLRPGSKTLKQAAPVTQEGPPCLQLNDGALDEAANNLDQAINK